MNTNVIPLPIEEIDQAKTTLDRILSYENAICQETASYHWNIRGANFYSLHELLEKQYSWLLERIDDVAERIRTIGFTADIDIGFAEKIMPKRSRIADKDYKRMLEDLIGLHKSITQYLRGSIQSMNSNNDFATADLLTKLLGEHEKQIWFLDSHLA